MNYNHYNQMLVGRNKSKKKLGNNTYLIKNQDGSLAVRLHNTDIVTYFEDGRIILNSGGWKTVTTKSRLNEFSPFSISQNKGIWTVCKRGDWNNSVLFKDEMSFNNGKFAGQAKDDKKENQLRKDIRNYSKLVVSKLPLPVPSNGDCWYCLMKAGDTRTLGEILNNTEHLLSHFKEKYVVPSLVYRALESAGCNPQVGGSAWFGYAFSHASQGFAQKQIERYVKKYLYRQFGLAA